MFKNILSHGIPSSTTTSSRNPLNIALPGRRSAFAASKPTAATTSSTSTSTWWRSAARCPASSPGTAKVTTKVTAKVTTSPSNDFNTTYRVNCVTAVATPNSPNSSSIGWPSVALLMATM